MTQLVTKSPPDKQPPTSHSITPIQPKVEPSSPMLRPQDHPQFEPAPQTLRLNVSIQARDAEIEALKSKAREDDWEKKALRELMDVLIEQQLKLKEQNGDLKKKWLKKKWLKKKWLKKKADMGMRTKVLKAKQHDGGIGFAEV